MAFTELSSRHHLRVFVTVIGMAAISVEVIRASDPDPLQDFCVADLEAGGPIINGYPCRAPKTVTSKDFAFAGLANATNLTRNAFNGSGTFGSIQQWHALNTLGLGLAWLDINPGRIIMPHTHNLASEFLFILEGEIYTDFVTNNRNPVVPNKLYAKTMKKGEAFMFPRGPMHFQYNKGKVPVVSLNVLNGQNAGFQFVSMALFGSGIDPYVLSKSFFIPEKQVVNMENIMLQFDNAFV